MNKTLLKLYIGSFLVSILPLAILFVVRWGQYVKSVPAGAFRLTLGGIMIAVVLVLKITHHLKIHSLCVFFVACALFCWLMQAVLNDMMVIFICAAVGQAVDEIFFQTAIKKKRQELEMDKEAQMLAERLDKIKGEKT